MTLRASSYSCSHSVGKHQRTALADVHQHIAHRCHTRLSRLRPRVLQSLPYSDCELGQVGSEDGWEIAQLSSRRMYTAARWRRSMRSKCAVDEEEDGAAECGETVDGVDSHSSACRMW